MSRRFLYLAPSLFPLGPFRGMQPVADHFSRTGNDVHVAVLGDGDPAGTTFPHWELHNFPNRDRRRIHQIPAFRRLVKKLQPELVHAWGEPAGTVARLALGGMDHVRLFVSRFGIANEQIRGWSLAVRRLGKRPEKIIVPHPALTRHLVSQGEREHRIIVIPPAALPPAQPRRDARRELGERFGIRDTTLILGSYAPFEPRYRLKDVLWAAHLLECAKLDAHFLLFGSGPQEWRLRRFLSQTQGGPIVDFVGEPADANHLFEGLDAWWHSHRRTPRDLNVLAAMRAGIPVIAVAGPGMEDVILNQVTGLEAGFGARDDFARWAKYLIEQPAAREQLARQASEHVTHAFPLAPNLAGYGDLYNWVHPEPVS